MTRSVDDVFSNLPAHKFDTHKTKVSHPRQEALMKFDPCFGTEKPYPSHAAQSRTFYGACAWLYNPWTGALRAPQDVATDLFGYLILPPEPSA